MKTARFVLKIVGASLAFAGAVCLVIGYWDKIMGLFEKKPQAVLETVEALEIEE